MSEFSQTVINALQPVCCSIKVVFNLLCVKDPQFDREFIGYRASSDLVFHVPGNGTRFALLKHIFVTLSWFNMRFFFNLNYFSPHLILFFLLDYKIDR